MKRLEKKGYMESPNDWRNVEITGYVKFNKGVNYDNFAWYAKGGIHTNGKDVKALHTKDNCIIQERLDLPKSNGSSVTSFHHTSSQWVQ